MSSLCQSESDDNAIPTIAESTPARRPSLSESLPRIPLKVQGCGVTITVKVGPHVRWTKILARWTAAFPDKSAAPMAWPVVLEIEDGTRIPISSIQESISRSIGPDILSAISETDSALVVTVGQTDRVDDPIEEDVDVPPPVTSHPVIADAPSAVTTPVLPEEPTASPPPAMPEFPKVLKIKIESILVTKSLKLNVSSGCAVGRLVRKWIEALRSTINPEIIDLRLADGNLLDREEKLSSVIPFDQVVDGKVTLNAVVRGDTSPPKKQRTKKSLERGSRTPPTTAAKKVRESHDEENPSSTSQMEELLYWQQMKSVRDSAEVDEGVRRLVLADDANEHELEDDDLALALALSLSEEFNNS